MIAQELARQKSAPALLVFTPPPPTVLALKVSPAVTATGLEGDKINSG